MTVRNCLQVRLETKREIILQHKADPGQDNFWIAAPVYLSWLWIASFGPYWLTSEHLHVCCPTTAPAPLSPATKKEKNMFHVSVKINECVLDTQSDKCLQKYRTFSRLMTRKSERMMVKDLYIGAITAHTFQHHHELCNIIQGQAAGLWWFSRKLCL